MQATVDYRDGMYSWEVCSPIHTPLGDLEPMFDAPVSGPTARQVVRWEELVENAKRHIEDARTILLENMAGFKQDHQIDELELVSIDLHDRPNVDYDWSLTFELQAEGFLYTVLFRGDEPKIVTVDG